VLASSAPDVPASAAPSSANPASGTRTGHSDAIAENLLVAARVRYSAFQVSR
jgi:hypothetical protein